GRRGVGRHPDELEAPGVVRRAVPGRLQELIRPHVRAGPVVGAVVAAALPGPGAGEERVVVLWVHARGWLVARWGRRWRRRCGRGCRRAGGRRRASLRAGAGAGGRPGGGRCRVRRGGGRRGGRGREHTATVECLLELGVDRSAAAPKVVQPCLAL